MKRKTIEIIKSLVAVIFSLVFVFSLSACAENSGAGGDNENKTNGEQSAGSGGINTSSGDVSDGDNGENADLPVTFGTSVYRGFTLDNVYHSGGGDIHYHSYFPEGYSANEKYALYISLPGYEGLYFQGVGSNIRSEDFVFEAQKYNDKMIIIAPQLNDWGQTSARQTVALTEFMLDNYPIDRAKVFINGYSGGGETLSLVLTIAPELFTAALHVASVWDGELEPLVNAETPVYFVIGESDEYYGSSRITATYNRLVSLYREKGLSSEDINRLAVLDVKPRSYFNGGNQHGGIGKVSRDEQIMGWLFRR